MVATTEPSTSSATCRSTPVPSKGIEWEKARKLFIESTPRPTYGELAALIGCAEGSLSRLSSEQGWPALRAQYMERRLAESDATGQIAQALSVDRTLVDGVSSVAIVSLSALSRTVEGIKDEQAASTKANVLNTCSFALKNIAESLKAVGLVGLSKRLEGASNGKDGQWDPKLYQQINLTVQTLASRQEEGKVGGATEEAKPVAPVQIDPTTPPLGRPTPP